MVILAIPIIFLKLNDLNDTLVLEYEETEEGIAQEGVICVQIHGGAPAEAWYKDIEIRTLGRLTQ